MAKPDARAVKLVNAMAAALAEYHHERPGNFSCHVQAANMLIQGPLWEYQLEDFFIYTKYEPI